MIYLDNSSTSHIKPKSILKKYLKNIKNFSINPSRGSYPLTIKAGLEVLKTRETIAKFFNAPKIENVIFTSGCTESINLALIGSKIKNGHILTTITEHNSVLRTLHYLQKKYNITVSFLPINPRTGEIEISTLEHSLKKNTYMVIINHTSNVTGATQNINAIGKFCKKHNLLFMVDAAQSAGHININIKEQNINFLCIAGHKGLLGPQGVGILIYNNTNLSPIRFGGTGTESLKTSQPKSTPDGFEAGTQNIPAIITLKTCFNYINKKQNHINYKIKKLSNLLIRELEKINEIDIYNHNIESGVVSINLKTKSLDDLYKHLNNANICTRNGLHCAPLMHKFLNTTKTGLIRISIGYHNTTKNIKTLVKQLKLFIKNQTN